MRPLGHSRLFKSWSLSQNVLKCRDARRTWVVVQSSKPVHDWQSGEDNNEEGVCVASTSVGLISIPPVLQPDGRTEVTRLSPEQTRHELTEAYLSHYGFTATIGPADSPRCFFLLLVFNPRAFLRRRVKCLAVNWLRDPTDPLLRWDLLH